MAGDFENIHPTVDLLPPGARKPVPIDKDIAPLIEALWSLGISTRASCQDFNDTGMVQLLLSGEDLRLFLTVIARNAERTIARKAEQAGSGPWRLDLWSLAWSRGKHTSISLTTAVRFPRSHLGEVTRTMAALASRNPQPS